MFQTRKYPLIEKHLEYTFRDEALLVEALTHGKHANGVPVPGRKDNARLAFLGDAAFELVVRHRLMRRVPPLSLKQLNDEADRLVDQATQARFARDLGVVAEIDFGGSKETDDLRRNPMLQSTAFEAVVGALYEDAGQANTYAVLDRMLAKDEGARATLAPL